MPKRFTRLIFNLKYYGKGWINTLIQFSLIFTFAWFNDCLFEMSIIYLLFFIFRTRFEKQFHAKTTWLCTLYTIIIFYIVSLISPNKSVSLMLIVLFTYSINQISFYVRDYLDLQNAIKNKTSKNNIVISKGMNKDLLLDYCKKAELNEMETNILIDFYCNRYSITKIAIKNEYSYDNIYLIKKKSLNKIRECFK